MNGPIGDLADGLSVVAAIAGTVGPLGFLSLQLSNAAGQLPWLSDSAGLQSLVVVLLTAVFATSTVSGIQKGIKWLSELNVWLTLLLGAGLLILGPGLWLFQHFLSGFWTYLVHLPQMALMPRTEVTEPWLNSWTVFYWGWFLGYAPLMGLFTAGVSRGRSIRELVLAVAILCPIVTNIWFTLLGGTGMNLELAGSGISDALAQNGAAAALLAILSALPLAGLLIPVGLILVVLFMCTSADSMSYAAAMVVSGRNEPSQRLRLFWALMIGSLTLVLLRIGTGLGDSTSIDALQAFIVITAVPVTPLVLFTLWSAPRLAFKEWQRSGQAAD